MVGEGWGPIDSKCVGLQYIFVLIREHNGFIVCLSHLEIRIQIASHVQITGNLSLTRTNDQQVASCRHRRSRRQFEHIDVVDVVRKEVTADIGCDISFVIKLHKILVISPHT